MQRFDARLAAAPRRLILPTLLAILPAAVAAQKTGDADANPKADLPRYTVELIVFTYAEDAWTGGEIFVPEPLPEPYTAPQENRPAVFGDLPSEPLSAPANDAPPVATGTKAPTPAGRPAKPDAEISGFDQDLADIPLRTRIELHLLAPEQYSMNEIYERLVKLDAYQPIMRAAWTQTTPPRDASPRIRLRALGDPPPGLDGTVKLYQGRFVHLGVDIALDAEALDGGAYDARQSATDRAIAASGVDDDAGVEGRTPEDAGPVWGDNPFEAAGFPVRPVRYRIEEVRIMKDGQVRYYDHPRFGVIARLTEVEEEKPDTPDDDAALAGDE